MVSILIQTSQLTRTDGMIQLGTCEIIFDLKNPNSPYRDQRFQNLCLAVPAEQLAVFLEQDDKTPSRHPFVRGAPGNHFIQVKVDSLDTQLPLHKLVRGKNCQVIVTPKSWDVNAKCGTSLILKNLRIVEANNDSLIDFI